MKNEVIAVSACLLGEKCRYDGFCAAKDKRITLEAGVKCIPICPEVMGGLDTPRSPAEIEPGGDGKAVLEGRARVLAKDGSDVTLAFVTGARLALEKCKAALVTKAVLKARSPSCGSGRIYDGSFTGTLKHGDGVTAALLLENGISVCDEEEAKRGL